MLLRSIVVFLFVLLLIPALPAQAKAIHLETQKSSTPNGKPAAALVLNGETVLQLAKDQHGHEPLRNVSIIATKLAEAFREGKFKLEVKEGTVERSYNLMLNGELLVTATDMEGKAWGAEPSVLAETWRDNIQNALASEFAAGGPQLSPELPQAHPPEETDPELEQVKFVFENASTPPPPDTAAAGTTAAIPTAAPAKSGGIIDMASSGSRNHPDYAGLTIASGDPVYEPPNYTKFIGTDLPAAGTVRVTGKKPLAAMLKRAIDHALRVQLKLSPADKLTWAGADADDGDSFKLDLPPGKTTKLEVKYKAQDKPEATTTLTLENRALGTPREEYTYFSNRPERIDNEQLLYYAELPGLQAARLVYHHQLARNWDLRLVARVINTGDKPSAIYVVPGDAAPDVNTFYVGYLSAEMFWKNLNRGNGYIASLPPGGQTVLIEQRLTGGQTGSGYYKIVNLGEGPLRIEMMALNPGTPIPAQAMQSQSGASGAVYGAPFYAITDTYHCGDPWKYLRLGDDKPASTTDSTTLDGCYGMTHTYSIELGNPLTRPALVFVVLRGSAGEVKGQFYIDDEYVGTPLVKGGDEQLLKEIPLKPGETKLLKITAIPLNGGFYPASIILRESRYP